MLNEYSVIQLCLFYITWLIQIYFIFSYFKEFRTKSNEIRYLLVNATTRRDAENNIVGVVGVAQDVTEAGKHDRAVAAMARELRLLVDTANAPIL